MLLLLPQIDYFTVERERRLRLDREGTSVISSPRGGPRDHGRGYPCPSHLRLWLDLEANGRRNPGEKNPLQTRKKEEEGEEMREMAKSGTISGCQTGCNYAHDRDDFGTLP